MEWRDQGIVVSVRRHAERGSVVYVFTSQHGLWAGWLRSAKAVAVGTVVDARWNARLNEHLGYWRLETVGHLLASLFHHPQRMLAASAILELLNLCCPSRMALPTLFDGSRWVLEALSDRSADWKVLYGRWELSLLSELGYRLDLKQCAVTGSEKRLCYVSPSSGRAVSLDAGSAIAPYRKRLLDLPAYWIDPSHAPTVQEFAAGMVTCSHFLNRWVLASKQSSPARQLLYQNALNTVDTDPADASSPPPREDPNGPEDVPNP